MGSGLEVRERTVAAVIENIVLSLRLLYAEAVVELDLCGTVSECFLPTALSYRRTGNFRTFPCMH